ncbi:head morphogenesis [Acinetobacter phage vB_AbaSi_W9]|nr:head morphogenesis [Acinetobacter phage vB_AbaSi_W9]
MTKIHDALTRLSMYVDQLKASKANEFRHVTEDIKKMLTKELSNVKYETLDGLSRADLNRMIERLRRGMNRVFNQHAKELLAWLKQFMIVTRKLVLQVMFYETVKRITNDDEELEENLKENYWSDKSEPLEDDKTTFLPLLMWASIAKRPMQVNGSLIATTISSVAASTVANIVKITRNAWSNGDTIKDTLDAYVAAFDKARGQNGATTATAMQQIYLQSKAVVMSAYYKEYVWVSILDKATSDICRSRNGKRYRFGSGILPPAHYRCRSHIEPYTGTPPDDRDFDSWLSSQPKSVRDSANEALTLGKFAERIKLILQ